MLLPLKIIEIKDTNIFNIVLISTLGLFVLRHVYKFAEQSYAEVKRKPFLLNFIVFKRNITKNQLAILRKEFTFYNKLSSKNRQIFNHRISVFMDDKNFIAREGLIINEEIKVLISATAVMLTFGFKNYKLPIIRTILVYPKSFYSKQNEQFHKGEMNPKLGVIALSWEDFKHGFDIENDNLNLGIHEFSHAIHFNSYENNDVSALIFRDGFKELKIYLKSNEIKRKELIKTRYFREYAYTNEFEFVAVLIECFFETPLEFKTSFPKIYNYVKLMLNFNFARY